MAKKPPPRNAANAIFYPKAVAVVGASRQEGSVGHSLLANLIGSRYKGTIFPVNPKATSILGIKAYPSVSELPDPVDLAVIVVPNRIVPAVLEECGRRNIRGVIIITAGFKEIGGDGVRLEGEVRDIIVRYGMAMVGPNCLGVINTDPSSSMNATFGTQMPARGNISFISQSGALCVAVLNYAREANIGFSKFISMGNKGGLTENDLLLYLKDDPKTDVILMYLEDLVDGREFLKIAWDVTNQSDKPKPIIALKSGRTILGAKAASSHTGSLAGSDKVYDAIFEQAGVFRVDTLEELFDYVKGFSLQPLPRGRNVAILTNSGGPGVLATDSAIHSGLNIAPLSLRTRKTLKKVLPSEAAINNPLDLIAEAQEKQYETAMGAMLGDKNIDAAIVILTPAAYTHVPKIAESVVKVARRFDKPVLACFLGVYDVSKGIEILEKSGIPSYRFPESAARVLSEMARFTQWLRRERTGIRKYSVDAAAVRSVIDAVRAEGRASLLEQESYEVLRAYGFPVIPSALASSKEEAVASARRIGFPVVLKIVSQDIIHKFDYGGVKLNLKNGAEVRRAYQDIIESVRTKKPEARIKGILVEGMAASGKEIILGMSRDPQFGPILMFGLGGIYVEALEDVSFRLAPIRELSAYHMITRTKTHKILEGFRGEKAYDIDAVADCLKRLSQLAMDLENIKELDINPMIVYEKGKGCAIVDARMILENP